MNETDKLYVLVRSDLTSGQQAVQAAHAAVSFYHHHRQLGAEWYEASQNLIVLDVADEDTLRWYLIRAAAEDIPAFAQREPDLDDAITAVAVGPGPDASTLTATLPLALRKDAMA